MNALSEKVLSILESTPLEKNSAFLLRTQSERAGIDLSLLTETQIPILAEHLESALSLLLRSGTGDVMDRIRALARGAVRQEEVVDVTGIVGGEAYLVTEPEEAYGYLMFRTLLRDRRGMVVSRKPPEKLEERYGIRTEEMYWLSRAETSSALNPIDLDTLGRKVHEFFTGNSGGVVLLDGVEYLLIYHEFRSIMRMISDLTDDAVVARGILLIPANPLAISQGNLELLKSEMTPVSRETVEGVLEEVFLIYRDGRLLAHATRRLRPEMDDEILSSMLVAVQNFVQDSFSDGSGMLRSLQFGKNRILIERGEYVYLAAVCSGRIPGDASLALQRTIRTIEDVFGEPLRDWDGDMKPFRNINKYLAEIIQGG